MAKQNDGCLNGILIGCGVLLVLVVGAGAFGYYKVVRPVQDRVTRVGEIAEQSEEAARRLEELNATYAYEPPDDLAEVVLEPDDVERYLAVRTEVADELARAVEAGSEQGAGPEPGAGLEEGARPEEAGTPDGKPATAPEGAVDGQATTTPEEGGGEVGLSDVGRMFSEVFSTFEAAAEARLSLRQAALEALTAENMSPEELRTLLHLVEWRFLGREEAAFLGLPHDERTLYLEQVSDMRNDLRTLPVAERFNAEVDGRSAEELRGRVERARMQISMLRERAPREPDALDSRTREALERRRADLEALEGEGLDLLWTLTEPRLEEPPPDVAPEG